MPTSPKRKLAAPRRKMVKVSLNLPESQVLASDEIATSGLLPFTSRSQAFSYIWSLGYAAWIKASKDFGVAGGNPLVPDFVPPEPKDSADRPASRRA